VILGAWTQGSARVGLPCNFAKMAGRRSDRHIVVGCQAARLEKASVPINLINYGRTPQWARPLREISAGVVLIMVVESGGGGT